MTAWFASLPAGMVGVAIFVTGVLRGLGYYAAGRAVRAGGVARASASLDRPVVRRVEALMGRFGAFVIPPAYFVVGLSAATLTTAGALGMPRGRFVAALTTGAAAWAAFIAMTGSALIGLVTAL